MTILGVEAIDADVAGFVDQRQPNVGEAFRYAVDRAPVLASAVHAVPSVDEAIEGTSVVCDHQRRQAVFLDVRSDEQLVQGRGVVRDEHLVVGACFDFQAVLERCVGSPDLHGSRSSEGDDDRLCIARCVTDGDVDEPAGDVHQREQRSSAAGPHRSSF